MHATIKHNCIGGADMKKKIAKILLKAMNILFVVYVMLGALLLGYFIGTIIK